MPIHAIMPTGLSMSEWYPPPLFGKNRQIFTRTERVARSTFLAGSFDRVTHHSERVATAGYSGKQHPSFVRMADDTGTRWTQARVGSNAHPEFDKKPGPF